MLNSYTYNDVYKSEIRMSLFRNPMKGDGNWVTAEKPIDPQNKPEKYIPKILEEIKYGSMRMVFSTGVLSWKEI